MLYKWWKMCYTNSYRAHQWLSLLRRWSRIHFCKVWWC